MGAFALPLENVTLTPSRNIAVGRWERRKMQSTWSGRNAISKRKR